jgi:hypothetical protein
MATFLSDCREAKVVTENLDEILPANRSQTRQRKDQESAGYRNSSYLLSCLLPENRQMQIKRFFKVPLSVS